MRAGLGLSGRGGAAEAEHPVEPLPEPAPGQLGSWPPAAELTRCCAPSKDTGPSRAGRWDFVSQLLQLRVALVQGEHGGVLAGVADPLEQWGWRRLGAHDQDRLTALGRSRRRMPIRRCGGVRRRGPADQGGGESVRRTAPLPPRRGARRGATARPRASRPPVTRPSPGSPQGPGEHGGALQPAGRGEHGPQGSHLFRVHRPIVSRTSGVWQDRDMAAEQGSTTGQKRRRPDRGVPGGTGDQGGARSGTAAARQPGDHRFAEGRARPGSRGGTGRRGARDGERRRGA